MSQEPVKRVLFSDGEGLVYTDFNDLQKLLQVAALDVSAWPILNLSANCGVDRGADPKYTLGSFCRTRAFTKGNGCQPQCGTNRESGTATALTSGLSPGMVGMWVKPATYFRPSMIDPRMRWVQLSSWLDVEFTHSSNSGGGSERFDIVTVAFTEVDGDAESRDFEDATTRAKTTSSTNKRTSVLATFTKYEGTPGAGVPSVPTDEGLLYVTRIAAASSALDTETDGWPRNMMLPYGHLAISHQLGKDGLYNSNFTLEAGGGIVGSASVAEAIFWDPVHGANPFARLLAIVPYWDLASGCTIEIGPYRTANNYELEVGSPHIDALSGVDGITYNVGSWHTDWIELEGPSFADSGPRWGGRYNYFMCNQGRVSHEDLIGAYVLALHLDDCGADDEIRALDWIWMVPG